MISSFKISDCLQEAGAGSDILVKGDGSVGIDAVVHLKNMGVVVFVGLNDPIVDRADEYASRPAETESNPDQSSGQIDSDPCLAILPVSQNSHNLLFLQYLQLESEINRIVVRVTNLQSIDANADLLVENAGAAEILGSELDRQLNHPSEPP